MLREKQDNLSCICHVHSIRFNRWPWHRYDIDLGINGNIYEIQRSNIYKLFIPILLR